MISIITPSFNRVGTLGRVYESLRNQAEIFEWIIVDDASSDNTVALVEALMLEDERIRYIKLPINIGVNGARMAGVDHSRFPFVFFLDSDDEVLPNALATLQNVSSALQGSIAVAVMPTSSYNDENGKNNFGFVEGQILSEYDIVCERVLEKELSYLYRRDVFEYQRLPEDMRACEFIFVYGLSRKFLFTIKNSVAVIIHRQTDNLSSSAGVVLRLGEIGLGYFKILEQHDTILQNNYKVRLIYFTKAVIRTKMAGLRIRNVISKNIPLTLLEEVIVSIVDLFPEKIMLSLERSRIIRINHKTFGRD